MDGMKPVCKLCGARHWGNDHVWSVTKVAEGVTKVTPPVTKVESVTKFGRPRKYANNAERQRAYRARKRTG